MNQSLASSLTVHYSGVTVVNGDFLEQNGNLGSFDVCLMNPPFAPSAADIKHITHAVRFLKPGGHLVAICANGPRQREALMDLADYWEDLPAGTFEASGTGVNTALLVIRKPAENAPLSPSDELEEEAESVAIEARAELAEADADPVFSCAGPACQLSLF